MKNSLFCFILALVCLAPSALAEGGDGLTRLIAAVEAMALGETFSTMPPEGVEAAVRELSRVYDFIGRVSDSGHCGYFIGTLKSEAEPPEIYIAADDAGWVAADNLGIHAAFQNGEDIFFEHFKDHAASEDGKIIFLDMEGARQYLTHVARAFFEPVGEERLWDMAARGVSMNAPVNAPHAGVYMLRDDTEYVAEYFLLTEEALSDFKTQKKLNGEKKRNYGIYYSPGGDEYDESLPEGLYEMARRKCGYVFVERLPDGDPIRAELAVFVNGEVKFSQVVEDDATLKRLMKALRGSKETYLGKCPYNARLTLAYADGSEILLYRATDSCDCLVAGSHVNRALGKKGAAEFDEIFSKAMRAARDR